MANKLYNDAQYERNLQQKNNWKHGEYSWRNTKKKRKNTEEHRSGNEVVSKEIGCGKLK